MTPFTTIGTASGLGSTSSSSAITGAQTVVAVPSKSSGSNGNGSTIAVAGGVIGGVALVSLVAFFIWFWRRRVLKKRRSTLLTPLDAIDPTFGQGAEKRSFFIRDGSIGPTPRSTKVRAAVRAQYGRVRGRIDGIARSASIRSTASHSTARSVDMNRGNSQYLDSSPMSGHDRKNSSALSTRNDSDMSIKERITEMWARFKGPRKEDSGDDRNDIFAARGIQEKRQPPKSRPLTNKPDFLTLLNMDDNELDREAQRRRFSRTRGGSEGSGLGGLNLDFGGDSFRDPFSDVNALATNNAQDPFSDANATTSTRAPPKPSTYVSDIRRSRHQSVGGSSIDLNKVYDLQGLRIVNESSRPPSGAGDVRDSAASYETFATKRDKFRSDPFDLEQLSSQVSGSIPPYTIRPGFDSPGLPMPMPAHTRHISDGSSKYTSGVSQHTLDEWSDPGPDVGPAVQRSSTIGRDQYNPFSDASAIGGSGRRTSRASSANSKMGYAM